MSQGVIVMAQKCPVTGVNIQRFLGMVFAGFIFIFITDYLGHGNALMGEYNQTKFLWRRPEDMQLYMAFSLMMKLLFIFIIGYIFTRNYENKGPKEGIRFGIMMGALIGLTHFTYYAYMPISLTLAASWFSLALLQMIGLGLIFSYIYKDADCDAAKQSTSKKSENKKSETEEIAA